MLIKDIGGMAEQPSKLKGLVKNVKQNVYVLYLAYRHSDTPWYAKVFSLFIVAYALSPIDFIPDVIPVLGFLDEAIILPLGILGAFAMIPDSVLQECRKTASEPHHMLRKNWVAGAVIILLWLVLAAWILFKWIL
ncbi:YkvA family protein [Camelliibacillus cellulosilyticus]